MAWSDWQWLIGGIGAVVVNEAIRRWRETQRDDRHRKNLAATMASDICHNAEIALGNCNFANNYRDGSYMFFQHLRKLQPASFHLYHENSSKLIILGTEKAEAIDAFFRQMERLGERLNSLDNPAKGDGNINSGQTRELMDGYQQACSLAIGAIEKLEPLAADAMRPNGRTLLELKQCLRRVSEGHNLSD